MMLRSAISSRILHQPAHIPKSIVPRLALFSAVLFRTASGNAAPQPRIPLARVRMEDISSYLSNCCVPTDGLAELSIKYGSHEIHGQDSKFRKSTDTFLREAPTIKFDSTFGKCTLVFVDPDAPDRAGDGSGPGTFGPWLHWIVTNCTDGDLSTGKQLVPHMGPAPPKGNHRYIFVLFQQTEETPGAVKNPLGVERKQWDFPGFIKANGPGLRPVAANFFYCSAD